MSDKSDSHAGDNSTPTRVITIKVTDDSAGLTIEQLCCRDLGLTHHVVSRAKFIPDGIMLDGVRSFSNTRVCAGQLLQVVIGDSARKIGHSRTLARPGPLSIVYEDTDILICDKPPGIPVHPGPGHFDDTLGNRLAAHFERSGQQLTVHVVHRLDKGTSGLLVVAKNAYTQARLQRGFHTDAFKRDYLAICHGCPLPRSGRIDVSLGPDPGKAHRQCVRPDGKSASTRYEVSTSNGGASLVFLELETGRTHQIRVHMASIGCPLFGDETYGAPPDPIDRAALHSSHLELIHPLSGQRLVFDSPLPPDMSELVDTLGLR